LLFKYNLTPRAAQRNSGARGKFLIRGPYFFQKILARGEEKTFPGHIQKKGSKNFSGQTPVKFRFENIFPTTTAKAHSFVPIPVKLRFKRFLSYHYLYK
jgi:hypothetical protein